MFLGKKIREARNEKGLTQKQLAEEIIKQGKKASNTTIANWESGLNSPDIDTLQVICNILEKDGNYFFDLKQPPMQSMQFKEIDKKRLFPILGEVKAGYDMLSFENTIGYIAIDKDLGDPENYYALKIKGDSMAPILNEDDIVVVHKQNDVENGNVAIILIDDEEATVKRIYKTEKGIKLEAFNPYYPTREFTVEEIEDRPVKIIGKVIEARIKKIFE